eukprot:2969203-Rhodomonas_salina.7
MAYIDIMTVGTRLLSQVTFRQMDPLIYIDLSRNRRPRILGLLSHLSDMLRYSVCLPKCHVTSGTGLIWKDSETI